MKLFRRVGKDKHVWSSELAGKKLVIYEGPEWGDKAKSTKTFGTPAKAKAKHEEALAAARKKGFREMGEIDPPSVPVARDAGLEAAIRESRGTKDETAAYLVYADWLQGKGAPLGDAIVFASKKKTKEALAIAKKHGLPPSDLAVPTYHLGLWQTLKIENTADWMENSFDPIAAATPLFTSPLCAALSELRLGVIRWDYNAKDVPALLALAGKQAWAADLSRLHLGDVDDDIDMDHHVIGEIGKVISKYFPKLAWLKLHSGGQDYDGTKNFGLDGLDLPQLKELVIETCALNKKRAKQLVGAKLPALERLELWFGDPERDANAGAADVAPILEGKTFPRLVHLGLCNTTLGGELIDRLAKSPLAKQLASLDFSRGTLDDAELGRLVAAAKAFPALTAISVDDTYVTKAAVRALKAAFPKATISAKEPKVIEDWAEGERFVTVGE